MADAKPTTNPPPPRLTKIITLKVTATDQALQAGTFRRAIVPTAPVRRRRGRPRKASILAMQAAQQQRQRQQQQQKQDPQPTGSIWAQVSAYSLPMMVKPADDKNTATTGLVPRNVSPVRTVRAPGLPPTPSTPEPRGRVVVRRDSGVGDQEAKLRRWDRGPNTAEFWWDRTVAEQGMESRDLDFKMLCLKLLRWREGNPVPRFPMGGLGVVWDVVVVDAVRKGKEWRRWRRGVERDRRVVARDAVWEGGRRELSRGRFVEEWRENAKWVVWREGVGGERVKEKTFRLGYVREGRPRGDGTFDASVAEHWVGAWEVVRGMRDVDMEDAESIGWE